MVIEVWNNQASNDLVVAKPALPWGYLCGNPVVTTQDVRPPNVFRHGLWRLIVHVVLLIKLIN